MLTFQQYLTEDSLRAKQMGEINQLIPQYVQHFKDNPIAQRAHVRIPHPLYSDAALQILRSTSEGRNESTLSFSYDRPDQPPTDIKHAINHSIAFALASAHHILEKDPKHVVTIIPMTENSKGQQSNAHTRLYAALIKHINSPQVGNNLSAFSGKVQHVAYPVDHPPLFEITKKK